MDSFDAILMAGHGTSDILAFNKALLTIESKISNNLPGYKIYKAFTNNKIKKRLNDKSGCLVDNINEAMNNLASYSINSLTVQSMHIIAGSEYEKMTEEVRKHKDKFNKIYIGAPLLDKSNKKIVDIIIRNTRLSSDEILLLAGHGSRDNDTSFYRQLEESFHNLGYDNVYVGVIKGSPGIKDIIKKIESRGNNVVLMPLLMFYGIHAQKDILGNEDSWLAQLEKNGYNVKTINSGLGELVGIEDVIIDHINNAAILTE